MVLLQSHPTAAPPRHPGPATAHHDRIRCTASPRGPRAGAIRLSAQLPLEAWRVSRTAWFWRSSAFPYAAYRP